MDAQIISYQLHFKQPAGTSRGVMYSKPAHFLMLRNGSKWGIGEVGILPGLSADDRSDFEKKLHELPSVLNGNWRETLREWPSLLFAVEQAMMMMDNKPFHFFDSDFLNQGAGQNINGLIWMGDLAFMNSQVEKRLTEGFTCLKMKVGAIGFEKEMEILKSLRQSFSKEHLEIRVDANGAFCPQNVMTVLSDLAELDIHSIEQPIKAGQWEEMAKICEVSPIPIALDEELIGVWDPMKMETLMDTIQPQYIILKPSLLGGFEMSDEWIALAEKHKSGWWVTSALESNIGLNAIAQYTAIKNNSLPQGLGTGSLYTNNIHSPLKVESGKLFYDKTLSWDLSPLKIEM